MESKPKCPRCGSLSLVLFSLPTAMKCDDCGKQFLIDKPEDIGQFFPTTQWSGQAFEFLAALHMSVRWELAPEVKKRLAELVDTFPGPDSRTPTAPLWVKCSERLPETDPEAQKRKWYLVTDGDRMDVALLLHGKTFMGHALQFSQVTHWCELPAPPEEK